jgi:two-component system LytT family sensor kinase
MNKQQLYWLFQISGWSTLALLNIFGIAFLSPRFLPIMALPIIAESVYFFLVTHVYRNLSKRLEWLQLQTIDLIPKVLLSIVGMAVTVYFVRVGTSLVLDLYSPELLSPSNLLGNISANIFILIMWSSVYFAFHYIEKNTQSLKYEVAMNEMKLNQLKAQINPHFIFNFLLFTFNQ